MTVEAKEHHGNARHLLRSLGLLSLLLQEFNTLEMKIAKLGQQ